MRFRLMAVGALLLLAGCDVAEAGRSLVRDDPSVVLDGRWAIAEPGCEPDRAAACETTLVVVEGRRARIEGDPPSDVDFSVAKGDPTIVQVAVEDDAYLFFALEPVASGAYAFWGVPCPAVGDGRRCAVAGLAEVRSLAKGAAPENRGRAVRLE